MIYDFFETEIMDVRLMMTQPISAEHQTFQVSSYRLKIVEIGFTTFREALTQSLWPPTDRVLLYLSSVHQTLKLHSHRG